MIIMRAVIAVLSFLSLAGPAAAEWIAVSAEQAFGTDTAEADACRTAESKAKEEAIRRVTGERLAAEDLMLCTERADQAECVLHRATWSMVDGDVTGSRNRKVATEPTGIDGFRRCTVRLEVDVTTAKGQPDPAFDLGVSLNQALFRPGETLTIQLSPSQPMHVAAFQWLPYESGERQVTRIFPNALDDSGAISQAATIPSAAGKRRYELQVSFPPNQPAGRRLVDEYLLVVATRKPIAFRDHYRLDDLKARLLEIPRSEARLVKRGYSVARAP